MTINEVMKVASVSADAVIEWMSENNYWNTDNEADELFYITEGERMVREILPKVLSSIGITHTENQGLAMRPFIFRTQNQFYFLFT